MFRSLQFKLRQNYLGKLQFRKNYRLTSTSTDSIREYFYYSLLLKTLGAPERFQQVIDIGCRNWSYVKVLAETFPNAKLIGIELDGLRRYWNLYRRIDVAQAHAMQIRDSGRMIEAFYGDFRQIQISHTPNPILFCFLFPFVSDYPCQKWGLPRHYADFRALIRHSQTLGHNNSWFSIHQGEWEAEEARKNYHQCGIQIKELVLKPSAWQGIWPSKHESWIFFSDSPS
jgi:hypothetical protein